MSNSTFDLHPERKLLASLQEECFKENVTNNQSIIFIYGSNKDDVSCPRIFDGLSCWNKTPASSTTSQSCPENIMVLDPLRTVYKLCTAVGTWQKGSTDPPWTDYKSCVVKNDLCSGVVGGTLAPLFVPLGCPGATEWFRLIINYIYVVGYIISVLALLGAMIIFLYFRNLRCARIQIHMHLFTSFIITDVLWTISYLAVINDAEVIRENAIWCKILHILSFYFMSASYAWMFVESLFLHLSVVKVFISNPRTMRRFVAIAWGGPVIVVALYVVVRHSGTDDVERCWMDLSKSLWCIAMPVGICLLVSSIIMINVIRDLNDPSTPFRHRRSTIAAKKAARAAMILIPLFGTHYILMPIRLSLDTLVGAIYHLVCALVTSPQGLCLAVLFCFTNQDVTNALNTYRARFRQRNDIETPTNAIPLVAINPA